MSKPLVTTRLPTRRYLLWFFMPPVLTAIAIVAMLLVFRSTGRLAPIPITGSVSYDEKLQLLRDRHGQSIDVLAVGSSMTLNNLKSDVVLQHLPPGVSFFNAASYGQKISQSRKLIEFLQPRFKAKAVIMICGPMDFDLNSSYHIAFDPADAGRFIGGECYPWSLARHFDALYYAREARTIATQRRSRSDYSHLHFDTGGGSPLEISYPNIDQARWNQKPDRQRDPNEYLELQKLAQFLESNHIPFFLAQPPLRQSCLTPDILPKLELHWQNINQALSSTGSKLINLQYDLPLPDSAYADYSHLNEQGAAIFTEKLMRQTATDLAAALTPQKSGTGAPPVASKLGEN